MEFSAWYIINAEQQEGLIHQSDAAMFLDVKRQSIKSRINCGSLKTYEYIDKNNVKHIFLSLKEIKNEKIKKGIKKD